MPWRDYNFSQRRDLAGESRFSLVAKPAGSGSGVAAVFETARCFSLFKRNLEVDRVFACFILRRTEARTSVE